MTVYFLIITFDMLWTSGDPRGWNTPLFKCLLPLKNVSKGFYSYVYCVYNQDPMTKKKFEITKNILA